jgi:hypothetical protein
VAIIREKPLGYVTIVTILLAGKTIRDYISAVGIRDL